MTTIAIIRDGKFYLADEPIPERARGPRGSVPVPYLTRDLPAYKSPLGDGVIEGRAARREHLKRTGKREVDPSEFKPSYVNPSVAKKLGEELTVDAKRPPPGQAKRAGV